MEEAQLIRMESGNDRKSREERKTEESNARVKSRERKELRDKSIVMESTQNIQYTP